jgi:hypothetical protein
MVVVHRRHQYRHGLNFLLVVAVFYHGLILTLQILYIVWHDTREEITEQGELSGRFWVE